MEMRHETGWKPSFRPSLFSRWWVVFLAAKLHYRPSQIALHDFSRSRHSMIGVGKQDWKEWIPRYPKVQRLLTTVAWNRSLKRKSVEKPVGPVGLMVRVINDEKRHSNRLSLTKNGYNSLRIMEYNNNFSK